MAAPTTVSVDHDYTPLPAQKRAHESPAEVIVFGASVGPGKTRFIVEHVFAKMLRWPGIPCLVLRERREHIKGTTQATWERFIPSVLWEDRSLGGGRSGSTYTIPNGSSVTFGGCHNYDAYMSGEYGLLAFDEAHEVSKAAVDNLQSRLRWIPKDGPPCERELCEASAEEHPAHPHYQTLICTNPTGGWLKREFYDRYVQGTLPNNHAFIQSKTADNPFLPRDYIDRMRRSGVSESWIHRMIEGDWTAFEGQIYKQFSQSTHVWPADMPYRHRAVDWLGSVDVGAPSTHAHRTVGLRACILDDETILVDMEYSKQGPASNDFEAWIKEQTEFGVKRWRGSPEQGRYFPLLSAEVGAPVRTAERHQGSRLVRTNRVHAALDIDRSRGNRPKLMIHERCKRLINGIESYREMPEPSSATARPSDDAIRRDDDEVDALAYLMEEVALTIDLGGRKSIEVDEGSPAPRVSSILAARRSAREKRLRQLLAKWGELGA